jgi:glycosyltransferase involved in cell wall biosynthesis
MHFTFITLGYHPDLDGGGYRYAAALAESLSRRGHRVEVISSNVNNELPSVEDVAGVKVYRLRGMSGGIPFWSNWLTRNRALSRLLHEKDQASNGTPAWDILISHHTYFGKAVRRWPHLGIYQGPWGLEYKLSKESPGRTGFARWMDRAMSGYLHRCDRQALDRMSRRMVASEYSRRSLGLWHRGFDGTADVIGGGVDLERFREVPDRNLLRARWGVDKQSFLWLSVRRLDARMGLDRLIRAYAGASVEGRKTELWLAGRGPQRQALEDLANGLGVADRVKFLGYVPESELSERYAAADCTVMPSLDLEGFGLATVESLACGTPVLASDAGANGELLEDLAPDLIYPVTEPAALEAKIRGILTGELGLPERTKCRDFVRDRHTWSKVAEKVEQIAFEERAKEGRRSGR